MLRIRKSSSMLAQAARLAQTAPPVPPVPQALAARTLVSSVLLTKDSYNDRKVPDLKTELKRRGLATSGKREELIRRLLQDDVRKAGSGSAEGTTEAPGQVIRRKATLANLRGNDKQQQPSKAEPKSQVSSQQAGSPQKQAASKEEKAEQLKDASEKASDLTIDPTVVVAAAGKIQPVAAPKDAPADAVPELKAPESNPPGIPPQDLPKVPTTFKIVIPYEQPEPERGAEIPLVTAYTSPGAAADRFAKKAAEETLKPVRKVLAVGGASNVPGGGVSSAAQDAGLESHEGDHSAGEAAKKAASSSLLGGLFSDVQRELGVTAEQVEQQAQKKAGSVTDAVSGKLSDLSKSVRAFSSSSSSNASGSSSSGSGSSSSGSGTSSSLNDQERTGAYLLGAILAGGYVISGLAQKRSALADDHHGKPTLTEKVAEKASDKAHDAAAAVGLASSSSSSSSKAPSSAASASGKGRVGKALDDLKAGSSAQGGSTAAAGAAADKSKNFASAAGIVGSGPRKV